MMSLGASFRLFTTLTGRKDSLHKLTDSQCWNSHWKIRPGSKSLNGRRSKRLGRELAMCFSITRTTWTRSFATWMEWTQIICPTGCRRTWSSWKIQFRSNCCVAQICWSRLQRQGCGILTMWVSVTIDNNFQSLKTAFSPNSLKLFWVRESSSLLEVAAIPSSSSSTLICWASIEAI